MNDEKMQEDSLDLEMGVEGDEMTDDDMAASLGFMTTLAEKSMFPGEETDLEDGDEAMEDQEEAEEDPLAEIEKNTDGTPNKDKDQDDRIAKIEMELERLMAEEGINDEETENTGTEA